MSGVKTSLPIPVYPRWRGEHWVFPKTHLRTTGLSPLARGTRGYGHLDVFPLRFIPAGAGNTQRRAGGRQRLPVYPRWRGEHFLAIYFLLLIAGLSPLARGTRGYGHLDVFPLRFIPAGAGNTQRRAGGRQRLPVYPRWRGEHFLAIYFLLLIAGLSPLARGTQQTQWQRRCSFRFIPAGAGNTRHDTAGNSLQPVYPRWRGEHDNFVFDLMASAGLSPLARGTLLIGTNPGSNARFIPAGAGNTRQRYRIRDAVAVYPRWRGEHWDADRIESISVGLSPLARGTL